LKITISPFSKSRDQSSSKIPLEELLPEITQKVEANQTKPGYREGVILVPLNPKNFTGKLRTLQEGDTLNGVFEPRQKGELPRKQIKVDPKSGGPDPIVAVDAVLYSNLVLAEGNENSDPKADFEVITFLTKITEEDQTMPPETLMANHFQWSGNGGTDTKMTAKQFETELHKSFLFWYNKAIIS